MPKKRVPANPEKVLKPDRRTRVNNLKDVTLTLPVGLLTCITGVQVPANLTLINRHMFPIAECQLNGRPSPNRHRIAIFRD
ncbi:hypothetical protein ACNKHR_10290 [Shigella flexneri]